MMGKEVRYVRFRAIGIVFYLFVAGSMCLAVIGIDMVITTHAPTWAILLFASLMAISVPLCGVVGYVFSITKGGGAGVFEQHP
jgi:hypothetical protein